MALSPLVMYRGQPSTSSTTLYTVTNSTGSYSIVKNIVICNTTSSAVTLQIGSVANGGSLTDGNTFFKAPIAAFSTVTMDLSMVLEQNESLRAIASESSAITMIVSGVDY